MAKCIHVAEFKLAVGGAAAAAADAGNSDDDVENGAPLANGASLEAQEFARFPVFCAKAPLALNTGEFDVLAAKLAQFAHRESTAMEPHVAMLILAENGQADEAIKNEMLQLIKASGVDDARVMWAFADFDNKPGAALEDAFVLMRLWSLLNGLYMGTRSCFAPLCCRCWTDARAKPALSIRFAERGEARERGK